VEVLSGKAKARIEDPMLVTPSLVTRSSLLLFKTTGRW
jgi:hypothetical protein